LLRSTSARFQNGRKKECKKLETGVATKHLLSAQQNNPQQTKVPANKLINAYTCMIIFTQSKMHETKLIGA